MKLFVVACLLVAATAASGSPVVAAALRSSADITARRALPALMHEEIHDEFGQYALRYLTAEGTMVSERGRMVPTADGKDYQLITEGEVSFIGDDGKTYMTKFTADLDGTRVEGTHLPVQGPVAFLNKM